MKPAVFIDRDGVLNHVVERGGRWVSPRTLDEFRLTDGLAAVAKTLRAAGMSIFVVTNQPDVARGLLQKEVLCAMNARIDAVVAPDDWWICDHDDGDRCTCRKPLPGGIIGLADRWNVDLARSVMIGDTEKDVGAALAAGVTPVILDRTYNSGVTAVYRVGTLEEAVSHAIRIAKIKEPVPWNT